MSERFTITHSETGDRLGGPAGERLDKALAILLTKPDIVLTEWYVTAWDTEQRDAYGEPEILWQVSAQEFVDVQERLREVRSREAYRDVFGMD